MAGIIIGEGIVPTESEPTRHHAYCEQPPRRSLDGHSHRVAEAVQYFKGSRRPSVENAPISPRDSKHSGVAHATSFQVGAGRRASLGITHANTDRNIDKTSQHRLLTDHGSNNRLRPVRQHWGDWLYGTRRGQFTFMIGSGLLIVCSGAFAWKAVCEDSGSDYNHDWEGAFWFAWTMFFDPGTQTGMPEDEPGHVKAVAVTLSIFGFVYNLSFLGMVVELVRSTLEMWLIHRARIVLTGHTLVLGWTGKTLFLLSELIHDAVMQGSQIDIVVLAERDEMDMKKEIRGHFRSLNKATRRAAATIRTRDGCPYDADDLERVSAASAKEVVVLGSESSSSDLEAIRVVMALAALNTMLSGRVVAEVQRPEYAYALAGVLPSAEGICARIATNCVLCLMATRPAVGFTFESFLDGSKGANLYAVEVPAFLGWKFPAVCNAIKRAIVVGVRPSGGGVIFVPPDDFEMGDGDKIICIARNFAAIMAQQRRCWDCCSRKVKQISRNGICLNPSVLAGTMVQAFEHTVVEASRKAESLAEEAVSATGAVFKHVAALPPALLNSLHRAGHDHSHTEGDHEGMDSQATGSRSWQTLAANIFVILGWAPDLPDILTVLDSLVSKTMVNKKHKALVHILSQKPRDQREQALKGRSFENIEIDKQVGHVGDRTSIRHLDLLPLRRSRAIMILSEGSTSPMQSNLKDPNYGHVDAITSDSACLTAMQMVTGVLEGRFGAQAGVSALESISLPMPEIICEVLDPRADRVVARSMTLRRKAHFFRSGALETGLFHVAASDPTSFNSLVLLLAESAGVSEGTVGEGEIVLLPITDYVKSQVQVSSENGRHSGHDAKRHSGGRKAVKMGTTAETRLSEPGRGVVDLVVNFSGQVRDMRTKTDPSGSKQILNPFVLSFSELRERVREDSAGILIGWQSVPDRDDESVPLDQLVNLVPEIDWNMRIAWAETDTLIVLRRRVEPEPDSGCDTEERSESGQILRLCSSKNMEDATEEPSEPVQIRCSTRSMEDAQLVQPGSVEDLITEHLA